MTDTIDWTQNCLTRTVHNGREGKFWNLPLGYAVLIFEADALRELVIERIYADALQCVEQGEGFTHEWAQALKALCEERYSYTLEAKLLELKKYYELASWKNEQQLTIRLLKRGHLNKNYEPLHSHDTINLLCRILGDSAQHATHIREIPMGGSND